MTTLAPEQEENPQAGQSEATKSQNAEQHAPEVVCEENGIADKQAGLPSFTDIVGEVKPQSFGDIVSEHKPLKRVCKDVVARRLGLPLKNDIGDRSKLRNPAVNVAARRLGLALKNDIGDLSNFRTPAVRNEPVRTAAMVDSISGQKRLARQVPNRLLQSAFRGVAGRALAALTGTSSDQPTTKWGSTGLRMDGEAVDMESRAQTMAIRRTMTKPRPGKNNPSTAPLKGGFGYGYGGKTNERGDKDAKHDNDDKDDKDDSAGEKESAKPAPPSSSFARAKVPQDVRSRNILGKMLGHLKSAKREFAKQKFVKVKEEDHWVPRRSPSHDLDPVSDDSSGANEKKGNSQAKRRKTDPREGTIMQEDEMIVLQRKLEIHYSRMKNFIRTRAEPTIFFLPAKHNEKTLKELEDTRETIDHKISSLQAHLQGESNRRNEDDLCVS